MANNDRTIDEKVVELSFDNSKFERNVSTSMSTLDRLKQKLDFSWAKKSFDELSASANNVRMDNLGNAVDRVSNKFSLFGAHAKSSMDDISASANRVDLSTLDSSVEKTEHRFSLFGTRASENLGQISKASDDVNLGALGVAVESVGEKFTALEVVATGALMQIGQTISNSLISAVGSAKNALDSVTVDQIGVGFDKYGEKTTAVQTIMAATGKSIEEVNEQLTKLNWFTDETSYTFTDMVSNIGKFTSAGADLATATTAMQGIANWAAISGQNAQAASRVMYNASQALGSGAWMTKDWMSVENANMATKEFKEYTIKAAKDLGKVEREYTDEFGHLVYVINGAKVSVEGFRESLADKDGTKWLTNDVFLKALDYYGGFTDKVYKVYNEFNENASEEVLTSEILAWIDEYKAGSLDIAAISEQVGMSVEDVKARFDLLSDSTQDLGKRAFMAGQEAKTFQDAIDSVREAVASGWMNTFEVIFGNYEEAKVLWTDLANELWDIFAGGAEGRNELFGKWKEAGGRDDMIEAMFEALYALEDVIEAVKTAFTDVFGEIDVDVLLSVTEKV